MRLSIILFLIFISVADCFCQFKNSIWCFGDSAGINFSNPNNPVPIETGLRTRGSCASIADSNDSLIFYANTRASVGGNTTRVYNKLNQVMLNGINIVGSGWYYELEIIPMPLNDSLFYLISCGVTSSTQYGIYYSVIDMTLDSGRGAVTLKNVQLQSFPISDGLAAVKHGNGRDWWLLFRDWDPNITNYNNDFYSYLITPAGISNCIIQSVGSVRVSGFMRIKFNKEGNKFVIQDGNGLMELYDFDRCTGIIGNPITIEPNVMPAPAYWSCEFSLDGSKLYVSGQPSPYNTSLFQYNLDTSNIAASKDTLWTLTNIQYATGQLKRGPDDKIYFSCAYTNPMFATYPYQDSIYNMYNMNLGVINSPDSLGAACNFLPYSFYLGGKRCYYGLPNNPDYEMEPLYGSACDSLSAGIENINPPKEEMFITYVSSWQKLFVNAQGLKGRSFKVSVYDMVGNVIYTAEGKLSGQYFTRDLNMAAFAKGMYIVNFVTDKERLAKKFIKD